jgi:hypothetical protein
MPRALSFRQAVTDPSDPLQLATAWVRPCSPRTQARIRLRVLRCLARMYVTLIGVAHRERISLRVHKLYLLASDLQGPMPTPAEAYGRYLRAHECAYRDRFVPVPPPPPPLPEGELKPRTGSHPATSITPSHTHASCSCPTHPSCSCPKHASSFCPTHASSSCPTHAGSLWGSWSTEADLEHVEELKRLRARVLGEGC